MGSRYETPHQAGISHFLEHLLFKGTERHSPEAIAQFFDGLGGEVNAATGRDYTVVYMRVLDEAIERALPVLADMLTSPAFQDLDQEREVVLEEIAMYEDDPQDQVHDMLASAVFPDQPLGRPVIGTRLAGVPELIAEGETGFVVTPGDERELAERLAELLGDPTLRRRMGEAGRARVERLFTREVRGEAVEAVYEEALAAKGGA